MGPDLAQVRLGLSGWQAEEEEERVTGRGRRRAGDRQRKRKSGWQGRTR